MVMSPSHFYHFPREKKKQFSNCWTMATLIAPEHFSPVEDAEALKKACKGNL